MEQTDLIIADNNRLKHINKQFTKGEYTPNKITKETSEDLISEVIRIRDKYHKHRKHIFDYEKNIGKIIVDIYHDSQELIMSWYH